MDVLGDTAAIAHQYAKLAGAAQATESDGSKVIVVPIELANAGVWSVSYDVRGDSIGGSLAVTISHVLIAPSSAATNELARIARQAGWTEQGPTPTVAGGFCGGISQLVQSSRYSDDVPLYSPEALNALRLIESTIPGPDNDEWRALVEDIREIGTRTAGIDNPTLEALASDERRLRSGCPDLLEDPTDLPPTSAGATGRAGADPSVASGDLIAILASIPIGQTARRDERLAALRNAGIEAFVLDSRDWKTLGDPYWVLAIGPADERYIGDDCADIEEEYRDLVDGCEPRYL